MGMPKNEVNRFRGSVYLVPITSARSAGASALLDQGSRGCGKEITETGNKAPVFQCGHKTFLAFCE